MALYSCSSTNYIASTEKLFIQSTAVGGGGFSVNYGAINSHTTKKINELDEKIMKELELLKGNDKEIYDTINDTNSNIELAKVAVIDTIDSIEKQDEKEAKKSVKLLTIVDKKLTSYIDMKNKDKYDLMKEFESKISEKEDEMNTKLSEKEELIQEMEEVAKELMDELQKESQSDKEKTIQEVKEKIISSLSE